MDVHTRTGQGIVAEMRPARGLMYSLVFGLAIWGGILGVAWLARTLLG